MGDFFGGLLGTAGSLFSNLFNINNQQANLDRQYSLDQSNIALQQQFNQQQQANLDRAYYTNLDQQAQARSDATHQFSNKFTDLARAGVNPLLGTAAGSGMQVVTPTASPSASAGSAPQHSYHPNAVQSADLGNSLSSLGSSVLGSVERLQNIVQRSNEVESSNYLVEQTMKNLHMTDAHIDKFQEEISNIASDTVLKGKQGQGIDADITLKDKQGGVAVADMLNKMANTALTNAHIDREKNAITFGDFTISLGSNPLKFAKELGGAFKELLAGATGIDMSSPDAIPNLLDSIQEQWAHSPLNPDSTPRDKGYYDGPGYKPLAPKVKR